MTVFEVLKKFKNEIRFFSVWNSTDNTCEFAGDYNDYMETPNTMYFEREKVKKLQCRKSNRTLIITF